MRYGQAANDSIGNLVLIQSFQDPLDRFDEHVRFPLSGPALGQFQAGFQGVVARQEVLKLARQRGHRWMAFHVPIVTEGRESATPWHKQLLRTEHRVNPPGRNLAVLDGVDNLAAAADAVAAGEKPRYGGRPR